MIFNILSSVYSFYYIRSLSSNRDITTRVNAHNEIIESEINKAKNKKKANH